MGLFCVNMHFRTTDDKALTAALKKRGVARFHVLPAKGGWTTLYEEEASHQDDRRIQELTGRLSRDLKSPAIAFMVHDSDIACYWLYENGQLLDEYNSCPAYFDDDATGDEPPSGGKPDVLARYCKSGVGEDEVASMLVGESVFAESVVEQLAEALGIDVERALSDYRDVGGGGGPRGHGDSDDDDDDGDGDDHGPQILSMREGLAARLTQMLGADQQASADPQAAALVQAAVKGDVAEIDRLLDTGAAVDAVGPGEIAGQPMAAAMQAFPGGMPKLPMTPLIAAVAHKRREAVERLLDRGADLNHVFALFGTAMHAAAGGGDVDMLRLLIRRGADVSPRNRAGQTPLQIVAQMRGTIERLTQARAMIKSMGVKIPGLTKQMSDVQIPTDGWEACERLLKEHGAV
jgi:hypothetical protein